MRHFSEEGIPDGYRHMNGFGSNTFKMVNSAGEAVYVKFHYLVSSTTSVFPPFFLLNNFEYICNIAVQFNSFFELEAIVIQTRNSS